WVEDLLDRAVQPVDLVDEEDVAVLEPREDRSHVAFTLDRGSGNSANANGELVAQDVREARLAESRWAGEEDVVERLAAVLGRLERDRQLLLDAFLAHEVAQRLRAQRALELRVLGEQFLCDDAHAASLNARRTCS